VHENGSSHGNEFPWDSPTEWELDLNKYGNGNTTIWERERLMLVGSENHSRGLVKSHYTHSSSKRMQHSKNIKSLVFLDFENNLKNVRPKTYSRKRVKI